VALWVVFLRGLIMKKAIAEFIGTFALVFIGCGTVVVGGMASGPTAITELAIALAFASLPWPTASGRSRVATSIRQSASEFLSPEE
jgi:Major intrinsic protein